jgi:hypothetical protein
VSGPLTCKLWPNQPKMHRCDWRPFQNALFTGPDNRFLDCAMLLFNNAICPGVISWDTDVADTKVSFKPVKGSYKGCTVVSNNFLNSSLSAQDFLEEECTKGAFCFCIEGMPFRPCSKQTMGLNDILIPYYMLYKHCVHICLSKKGCWCSNHWGIWTLVIWQILHLWQVLMPSRLSTIWGKLRAIITH